MTTRTFEPWSCSSGGKLLQEWYRTLGAAAPFSLRESLERSSAVSTQPEGESEQSPHHLLKVLWEFLLWLSGLRIQHSEDTGLIPGLIQWVKDLALLQAAA